MQKFTQKWCLVSFLEPIDTGFEFYWKDWPLHVTLASVFAINWNESKIEELRSIIENTTSFQITATKALNWGGKYKAIEIEKSTEIMRFHDDLYNFLLDNGAKFNSPQYEGPNYLPHSTIQKHVTLEEGETRSIDNLCLVDMFPNGDGYRRKVTKTWELQL